METNKEQNRVNTYFQDVTIKNACELLAIEKRLQLDGLVLPNNVIVNRNGISCAEFIQWYEKSQYPKTYEECHELMVQWKEYDCNPNSELILCDAPIHDFCKLIVARNIYWKIAGEELGLGKPWKPDWTIFEGMPSIFIFRNNIVCDFIKDYNCLLVFPTKEIRDAFYENFKDLIEQCKELL